MENDQKENLAEEFCSDARHESCPRPEVYCDTSRIGETDEQHGSGGIEPARRDFELKWIYAEYGAGRAVSEIAKETGINRTTLSKMLKHQGSSTVTDNLDKLCFYFNCEIELGF